MIEQEEDNEMEFDNPPSKQEKNIAFLKAVVQAFNAFNENQKHFISLFNKYNKNNKTSLQQVMVAFNAFNENQKNFISLCTSHSIKPEALHKKLQKKFGQEIVEHGHTYDQATSIISDYFNLDHFNSDHFNFNLLNQREQFVQSRISVAYALAYVDKDNNLENFGKQLFDAWGTMSSQDKKIVERGFEVLKKAYPDGEINDNFNKVQENQYFRDFLKICAIMLTLGVAALSEKTTLQSTKQRKFKNLLKRTNIKSQTL